MLVGLFVIFALLIFLAFFEEYLGKYKWMAYILVGIVLILYSSLRPIGFDRDSPNYEMMFMNPDAKESVISVEPSFLWISKICSYLVQDVRPVIVIYALLGVILKMCAIKKYTPLFFLPLVIYFGNFYYLHELTQIRAGIASAFFLLSVPYIAQGKRFIALLLMLTACLFHYSALSLLPLLLLNNNPLGRKMKIAVAMIVPMCFVLYFLGLDLLTSVPIPYVTDKVEAYKALSEYGPVEKNSILNPFPLMKMVVLLYFLYFSETISKYVPYIHILIKILACSLFVYFAFSSITIFSTRISELYGIIEIVAYPCIVFTIRPKFVGKLLVCIMAIIEMVFNCIVWDFFDFNV